jgi:glycosyltransferase involved in cell wall biosynthesis
MRTLYISHYGGLGGAERSLLELMVAVRPLGIEAALICPDGPLLREANAAGIPVSAWCACTITRSLRSSGLGGIFRGWRELYHAIDRFLPDVLHVNSAQAMLWTGPAGRCCGRPVVWHWRDFVPSHRLLKLLALGADAIVAISNAVLAFAGEILGHSSPRLMLVRNGIADLAPVEEARTAVLRGTLGVGSQSPLVVMAGQSVPRKGHAILLDAIARLAPKYPHMRAWMLCAEHTPEAAAHTRQLRQKAAELGCAQSVCISEGIDQIAPALRAADIVVAPSLREPFGRIAVEAMLAERPVLASAVDGLNEIVLDGETGLLVPPGDSASLARGLACLLDDPEMRLCMGQAARRRALQLFSISRVAREITSLYQTLRSS